MELLPRARELVLSLSRRVELLADEGAGAVERRAIHERERRGVPETSSPFGEVAPLGLLLCQLTAAPVGILEQSFYVGQARSRGAFRLFELSPVGLRVLEQAPKLLTRWPFTESHAKLLCALADAGLPASKPARGVEFFRDGRRTVGNGAQLP